MKTARVTLEGVRRPRHGFTLLEILASIFIIAILTALLFPSIGSAREKAKAVGCVNNLRQIGQAIFMYAGDNGGRLPQSQAYGIQTFEECVTALEPYSKDTDKLWQCPARPDLKKLNFTGYVQGNYHSAFYFGHPSQKGGPFTLMQVDEVVDPQRRWLLADMDAWNYANQNIARIAPTPAHNFGRNILYIDGSSRWIQSVQNVWP